jgi:hypothetical protein
MSTTPPETDPMTTTLKLTAFISKERSEYVALCPEVDVANQGVGVEDARADLIE